MQPERLSDLKSIEETGKLDSNLKGLESLSTQNAVRAMMAASALTIPAGCVTQGKGFVGPQVIGELPAGVGQEYLSVPGFDKMETLWAIPTEDKFVPQGISVAGDRLLICGYRSLVGNTGPSVIHIIDKGTNELVNTIKLPKKFDHTGGLDTGVYQGEKVVAVANKGTLSLADLNDNGKWTQVKEFKIGKGLGPSCIAMDGSKVWLVEWHKGERVQLGQFDLDRLADKSILEMADAEKTLTLTVKDSRIQGIAIGDDGMLYLSRSSSTFGQILKVDPETGNVLGTEAMPAGTEDIDFTKDGNLISLSESGATRYKLWKTDFPFAFELDKAKLFRGA